MDSPKYKVEKGPQRAFTRVDLLAAILGVSILAMLALVWIERAGRVTNESTCQANLKAIGVGLTMYGAQNNSKMPIAAVDFGNRMPMGWDTLIYSQIRTELARREPEKAKLTTGDVGNMFACPADTVPRNRSSMFNRKRSYAMTEHSMTAPNWPPGANNQTGVGLAWSMRNGGNQALDNYLTPSNSLPAVRLDMLQEPKATITVTEMVNGQNMMVGNGSGATVASTAAQLDTGKLPAAQHHEGKFNYLMVDGHVEFLKPGKTVGDGEAGTNVAKHLGMWTIKAGD